MQVKVETPRSKRGPCIVHLTGDIDIYSSNDVNGAIDEVIGLEHYNLLFNLKTVRYIDSTGLGIFIGALKRVRPHGGAINFVYANPTVKRVFEITGLLKEFGVYDDEQSALRALS
jgi:anti-anti-sigma factor